MSLKKCITEEINNFINEGRVFDDSNFIFKDKVDKCEFVQYESYSNEHSVETSEYNIFIKWKIGFWLNDNGIENFLITILDVEGDYDVTFTSKLSGEVTNKGKNNILDTTWQYTIDGTAELKLGQSLYVDSVVFDFGNKNCIVKFI